jgi:hypothetical protein
MRRKRRNSAEGIVGILILVIYLLTHVRPH